MLYLDYAATTPVRPEVKQEMERFFAAEFSNPHSPHEAGLRAKQAVEDARERIAAVLGALQRQIIFSSGGTEANNLAIFGAARARKSRGKHVLTTEIEHKSVLAPFAALQREDFTTGIIPVDSTGRVRLEEMSELVKQGTILVAVGHANNEIGTIQPIAEISALTHRHGALLHCDAVQSFGKLPVNVKELGVDLLTVSGHKIYGPKGAGVLYIGPGVRLEPLIYGGGQERGLRPGTLNVPAIMGLAKAIELAGAEQNWQFTRMSRLRDRIVECALAIGGVYLNGPRETRLPNHINLGIHGVEGQLIVAELAKRDIAISSVAACSSGSREPSHVLLAVGQSKGQSVEGFRITLGISTTEQEIELFNNCLAEVIRDVRARFMR